MMTAKNKSPDSISYSDDSDTLSPPNSKSAVYPKMKHCKADKYKPNIKSKHLNPKNKSNMQRSFQ